MKETMIQAIAISVATIAVVYLIFRKKRQQNTNYDIFQAVEKLDLEYIRNVPFSTLETTNKDGNTPLMISLEKGNIHVVKSLIERGASLNTKNIHLFTPLHKACYHNCSDYIIKLLLDEKPTLVSSTDQNGWSALHVATASNNIKHIKLLLQFGSDINLQTSSGHTAIIIASNNGFTELVDLFLENKANLFLRTKPRLETALIFAVANSRKEIIEKLLKHEPSLLHTPTIEGTLPLFVAVAKGNEDIADYLIKCGADVNARKQDQSTALHVAVNTVNVDMVKFLVKSGADVNIADSFGSTPLHRACNKKFVDLAKILLENGANPFISDNDQLNSLHVLCSAPEKKNNNTTTTTTSTTEPTENESVKILNLLFENVSKNGGISKIKELILQKDSIGANALHVAVCKKNNLEIVKIIINLAIEAAFLEDQSKRTPLHLLLQAYKSHTDIIELLKSEMKKHNPSFFDTFDEKQYVLVNNNRIFSKLSHNEKTSVFDGEDPSIQSLISMIKKKKFKNIIVLTGAGISTSAGIPDFRSEKGIYSNPIQVQSTTTDNKTHSIQASDAFSREAFFNDPTSFFSVVKHVFLPVVEGKYKPTFCHKFLTYLHNQGLLLRNYTQNIDTLERISGLPGDKVVEAHGSFASATCVLCKRKETKLEEFWDSVRNDKLPKCKECNDDKGILKPDVILFGESLPTEFFESIQDDFALCDLLIVMGTSLKVYPFAGLVNKVKDTCPRILFNQEVVAAFTKGVKQKVEGNTLQTVDQGLEGTYRDVALVGDIDKSLKFLAESLDWKIEN
eukprot:TRINITY_DN4567_c0_g2_i1.p1 TRINITY_DN4567_c0_g2~~TRINITY_DN4567_c0_g2_i1.p1  ORF type:complete len:792 (-),score=177.02 TRINITY_DN4567_c0_g2_i1:15-2390(-)